VTGESLQQEHTRTAWILLLLCHVEGAALDLAIMSAALPLNAPMGDVAESGLADLHFTQLIFNFVGFRQNLKEARDSRLTSFAALATGIRPGSDATRRRP
jgi:hypothetical protein